MIPGEALDVANLGPPMGIVGDRYWQRGDNEKLHGELMNQRGGSRLNVKNLARSELMAGMVPLIHNWWSVVGCISAGGASPPGFLVQGSGQSRGFSSKPIFPYENFS